MPNLQALAQMAVKPPSGPVGDVADRLVLILKAGGWLNLCCDVTNIKTRVAARGIHFCHTC